MAEKRSSTAVARTRPPLHGEPGRALDRLHALPGFMIRRAHQISTAVFTQSCAELDLTPSQYSVLFVLEHCGPLGQNELGRMVALDRSTTALVVRLLKARRLVAATPDDHDRRKTQLALTANGRRTLSRAGRLSARAGKQLLSVFSATQARHFVDLLEQLTTSFGAESAASRRRHAIELSR